MTDRYAVIGNPVAHSKSPVIHRAFALQTGQDMDYCRLLAAPDAFAESLAGFRASGAAGANVTVPFKETAWQLATHRTARAQRAGAANTLRFDGQEMLADNTDGVGLLRDITINLGTAINGKRVLVLGAGGAARGILGPLLDHAPATIIIANRTVSRARTLAGAFGPTCTGSSYADLAGQRFEVLINATSAGLSETSLPLPCNLVTPGALAYELVYGLETSFMRWAREQGAARIADGLGMLVEQAAESFLLWRGVRPDTLPVIRQLREQG
jgi:shikimate dehydrogenase